MPKFRVQTPHPQPWNKFQVNLKIQIRFDVPHVLNLTHPNLLLPENLNSVLKKRPKRQNGSDSGNPEFLSVSEGGPFLPISHGPLSISHDPLSSSLFLRVGPSCLSLISPISPNHYHHYHHVSYKNIP